MLPDFLIPETTIHESGTGGTLDLGEDAPMVLVTLGITETVEQESLLVTLHGSMNGNDWSAAPVAAFPEKFYSGVSSVMIDPQRQGPFRYLRAQWKTNRWGRGSKTPMFRVYLFTERAD